MDPKPKVKPPPPPKPGSKKVKLPPSPPKPQLQAQQVPGTKVQGTIATGTGTIPFTTHTNPTWNANQNEFLSGNPIIFSGIKFLGLLEITNKFPPPNERTGLLLLIDQAQRDGILPWIAKENRELHLYASRIDIATDPNNVPSWEKHQPAKIFYSINISDVSHISFLDDDTQNIIVIRSTRPAPGVCYLLSIVSEQYGNDVIDCINQALAAVYTQAVLGSLDDSIITGLQGKESAAQRKAAQEEEAKQLRARLEQDKLKRQGLNEPQQIDNNQSQHQQEDEANDQNNKRKTIFQLFAIPNDSKDRANSVSPDVKLQPLTKKQQPKHDDSDDDDDDEDDSKADDQSTKASQLSRAESPQNNQGTIRMVEGYMSLIQRELSAEEMKKFVSILQQYRQEENFSTFWLDLVSLFGSSRPQLLVGLDAFVLSDHKKQYNDEVAKLPK